MVRRAAEEQIKGCAELLSLCWEGGAEQAELLRCCWQGTGCADLLSHCLEGGGSELLSLCFEGGGGGYELQIHSGDREAWCAEQLCHSWEGSRVG